MGLMQAVATLCFVDRKQFVSDGAICHRCMQKRVICHPCEYWQGDGTLGGMLLPTSSSSE